jgi:hypothetical protein
MRILFQQCPLSRIRWGTGQCIWLFSRERFCTGASLPSLEQGKADSYDLIYNIVPELVLSTDRGQQTISLTPLTSTLFFASSKHLGCYTLEGNTFVKAAGVSVPNANKGWIYCV